MLFHMMLFLSSNPSFKSINPTSKRPIETAVLRVTYTCVTKFSTKHLSLFIQKAKGRPPEAIKPPYTRKDQVSGPRVHKGRKDPSLLKHYLLLCDLGSHQRCFLRCFVPRFVRGWNGFFQRLVQIWQRWFISTHIL